MSKELTEKLKNGELDNYSYYYFKDNDETFIDIALRIPFDDVECLAPVPTYEEWKTAKENLEKNGTWYTERAYKRIEKQLAIATKALKETKEKLLHVELSGLDGDNRQKMYDLMFEDGVIDKALKEMEGVK